MEIPTQPVQAQPAVVVEGMSFEEIKASVEALRARRSSIPELRNYKPQGRGSKKAAAAAEPERDVTEIFGDLIKSE